jgi:transcriptional regulator GlxA family with amidase domain
MDGRISYVMRAVSKDVARSWTVDKMAREVGWSTSHFRRRFREETQVSPTRFLLELRLDFARQLLETSFLQVKEITRSIGLSSESDFNRHFKRKFGVPPTRYRDEAWELRDLIETDKQ